MKDLFSVCITHYNQMDFVFNAIDSVLMQDYPNIELIVSDDGSEFDEEKVKNYINKNKKNNIKKVNIITRDKNVGTVKNLNNVVKNANGEYLTFFAADDELSDDRVISNYYDAFKKYNKMVITAQAYLYDENLLINNGPYINVDEALEYNKMEPKDVFYHVAKSCLYASGATAYDMKLFDKYGSFNEEYLLVEDWSYYLHLLKNNVSIFFVDFSALNHRDGGVSHNTKITPTVRKYYADIFKIYENEILNDMPDISDYKKMEIYNKCKSDYDYICDLLGISDKAKYINMVNDSINKNVDHSFVVYYKFISFIKWHVIDKIKKMNKSYHIFVMAIIYWFVINIILNGYYVDMSNETKIMVLFSSLIGSCLSANLLIGIGKHMEYCVPLSLLTIYCLDIISMDNIVIIMLLFLLIYVVYYYIIYVLDIVLKKYRGR